VESSKFFPARSCLGWHWQQLPLRFDVLDLASAVMMSIATKEGLASRSRKGIRLGPVAGVSLGFEASPPCRGVPAARVGAILVGRLCDPSPSVRSSRSRPNCTSGALTGQGMLGLYVAFPH